jgi:hypothetical protein
MNLITISFKVLLKQRKNFKLLKYLGKLVFFDDDVSENFKNYFKSIYLNIIRFKINNQKMFRNFFC